MFRVHTPIIRSIRCWVAAYGFLHRVFGWEPLRGSCVRCGWCRTAPSAPYTRPTQRISRPPPIQKLDAENHMLQLNIWCSWWWAYVPETCRAKNTSIKLPCCIKLPFHIISICPSFALLPVVPFMKSLSGFREVNFGWGGGDLLVQFEVQYYARIFNLWTWKKYHIFSISIRRYFPTFLSASLEYFETRGFKKI